MRKCTAQVQHQSQFTAISYHVKFSVNWLKAGLAVKRFYPALINNIAWCLCELLQYQLRYKTKCPRRLFFCVGIYYAYYFKGMVAALRKWHSTSRAIQKDCYKNTPFPYALIVGFRSEVFHKIPKIFIANFFVSTTPCCSTKRQLANKFFPSGGLKNVTTLSSFGVAHSQKKAGER